MMAVSVFFTDARTAPSLVRESQIHRKSRTCFAERVNMQGRQSANRTRLLNLLFTIFPRVSLCVTRATPAAYRLISRIISRYANLREASSENRVADTTAVAAGDHTRRLYRRLSRYAPRPCQEITDTGERGESDVTRAPSTRWLHLPTE